MNIKAHDITLWIVTCGLIAIAIINPSLDNIIIPSLVTSFLGHGLINSISSQNQEKNKNASGVG
jgi:hypothetical protein